MYVPAYYKEEGGHASLQEVIMPFASSFVLTRKYIYLSKYW